VANNVRFGSKGDVCAAKSDVHFIPNSDRESGFSRKAVSALPPKADICSALADVRFGPIADIRSFDECVRAEQKRFWNGQTYSLRSLEINY